MRRCGTRSLVATGALLLGLAAPASAQDIEPRAYSASPIGTTFVGIVYSHQTGGVLVDPTVPIEDVTVNLDGTTAFVGRTFGLAGRQASVTIAIPYVWGDVEGTVFEDRLKVTRSGAADLRLRFAMNLVGGPALTPREFATRKHRTTLGASLSVIAPTGQYDPERLINLGSNRWAFKPELGLSHPVGPWTFEAIGGVWLYTENHRYFGGKSFEQRPIGTVQGNVSYTFRPRLWVGGGVTYFAGGRTAVSGAEKETFQSNSRAGLVLSLPVSRIQSVKLSWLRGVRTRIGSNLNTVAVGWQFAWF